ncbi:MAG TPA: aminotransferase class V-fold PLP-dependent enzyme [Candidatus Baltobacteraceae bacterium]|nr:aminotransferase class V-fold PLP-dependent enzyme [Candidatus Baltobacteraceae bacterium]
MLDPADWERFRQAAHRALDDALDYLQNVRERPVWRPVPDEVKARLCTPMPQDGRSFDDVYQEFTQTILPYATGNVHPRFWGWVNGTGTPSGAIAEMLAAVMNPNVGGRDHGAVYVERQVVAWFRDLFGWPETASGLLLTGTSAANLAAVLVARTSTLGHDVRENGLDQRTRPLVGYASAATHACVRKAFENAGLGSAHLRVLPIDAAHRVDPRVVAQAIAGDRAAGLQPFFLTGNAGTVDVGAIDPLEELAELAHREGLWFHVDGAFGAAAYLSPTLRPKLRGIERADSIAFDFHKWLHVPYDAGCVLVRDGEMHRATFASEGPYITRMKRGLAAGEPWFTDYGPDLSRGFRALKVWFTIKEHGAQGLARGIERNCEQARYLESKLEADELFEVAGPVDLQIVCFRPRVPGLSPEVLDQLTDESVMRLQEGGVAVISSTTVEGRRVMRACITNHRTQEADLDLMIEELRRIVREAAGELT